MNFVQIMWLVTGITSVFAGGVLTLMIAGKDILLAFKRKVIKQGCDVYISTKTRHITHHYKVPKDDVFRISGKMYISNPDKILNMDDTAKREVFKKMKLNPDEQDLIVKSLTKRQEGLQSKITALNVKIKEHTEEYERENDNNKLKDLELKVSQLSVLRDKYEVLLHPKSQNYYKDIRPAFFFLEGDPIPKDFNEYYSGVDSQIIDNIVNRAQLTVDFNAEKQQKDIATLKMIIYGIAAGVAFCVFTLLKIQTALQAAGVDLVV